VSATHVQSMRERAARIGAELSVTTGNTGTDVTLTVPSGAIQRNPRDIKQVYSRRTRHDNDS